MRRPAGGSRQYPAVLITTGKLVPAVYLRCLLQCAPSRLHPACGYPHNSQIVFCYSLRVRSGSRSCRRPRRPGGAAAFAQADGNAATHAHRLAGQPADQPAGELIRTATHTLTHRHGSSGDCRLILTLTGDATPHALRLARQPADQPAGTPACAATHHLIQMHGAFWCRLHVPAAVAFALRHALGGRPGSSDVDVISGDMCAPETCYYYR